MMNKQYAQEILINATRVSPSDYTEIYEFVINQDLKVIECVQVESLADGISFPVENYRAQLGGVLFELNHVRVNPRLDNSEIIHALTSALEGIGVGINHPPSQDSMALCFKPLGEINDNVRFHFENDGYFHFLTPSVKLKIIHNQEKRA